MKKKLKALPLSIHQLVDLIEARDIAKSARQAEYGVPFTIEKYTEGEKTLSRAILFQDAGHTKRELSIAAARVNALHFVEQVFVTDLVVNQCA